MIVFLFSQNIGFGISCETTCMKRQNLFSGENKEKKKKKKKKKKE